MSRYRFIDQHRLRCPVRRRCQALGVAPSRYYAWQRRRQQTDEQREPAWAVALDQTFERHRKRYGTRRLRVARRQRGHRVGRQARRTAVRRRGLRAWQPQACTPRAADSTHGLRCAPNRLLDQPPLVQANRVWVSDITCLPLASGEWAYLCAFGQSCGNAYRALLHRHQAWRSPRRRGECHDNAPAESLWSRLKTEELEAREWPVFADLADAQASVATCFDYYDHERPHSSIGCQVPYLAHQQTI